MAETKQYVLGRGKLYFSRFVEGTQTPHDFLYFGNTPEFSLSIEVEDLPHYNADEGIREEDDNVVLEVTRTASLVTDNIIPENVALFLMGDSSILTQAAVLPVSMTLDAPKAGYSYQVGQSDTMQSGAMGIDPATFLVMTAFGATAATGTFTVGAGNAQNNNTVTIGTRTYTFRTTLSSGPTVPNEILIGATVTETATRLVAAIMGTAGEGSTYSIGTLPHPQVSATNTAGVVTITSRLLGVAGNSLALSAVGANLTVSGATLTGGANGTVLTEGTHYTMNFDTGFLSFINPSPGGIVNGTADIVVNYGIRASTRVVVLSGNTHVEGALRFETKNARGKDSVFYMPWVKVAPNGDYNLKGDEWQQIPLSIKVLRKEGSQAIYRDGLPAYS
jgi:hypothetical protein